MLSSKIGAVLGQTERLTATFAARTYVTIHQPPPDKPGSFERKRREEPVPMHEVFGAKQALEKEDMDVSLKAAKDRAKEAAGIVEDWMRGENKGQNTQKQMGQAGEQIKETVGKTTEQAKSTVKAAKDKIIGTAKMAKEKILGHKEPPKESP